MPETKPLFIDPPALFRSPRYTNVVVAKGFAFRANLPLLVEVDAIVALPNSRG